jgi:transposase
MITKVYKYGLKKPSEESRKILSEQMGLANKYYNKIIENERAGVLERYALMSEYADIEMLEAWYAHEKDDIAAAAKIIKDSRKKTQKRSETAEQREYLSMLRERAKEILFLLKEARARKKEDPFYSERIKEINKSTSEKNKRAYHEYAGCYWGTKTIQKESADVAVRSARKDLPSFRRGGGNCVIGVQVHYGVPATEISTCSMVQVDRPEKWEKRCVVGARVRVGSTGKNNSIPIWCQLEMIMHRPFPDGSTIKVAKVVRKVLAGKEKYEMLFVLELPTPKKENIDENKCISLDLGWRLLKNGELRIGYMWDGKNEKELKLPTRITNAIDKAYYIQSVRDQNLNEHKKYMLKALSVAPIEWHEKYCKYLHLSSSQRRWSWFARQWRDDRWEGDEFLFEIMEKWRKGDAHLWLYQENSRDQALACRKDLYRNIGARLAREYDVLVVEDFNLMESQRKSKLESGKVDIMAARRQQRNAAPHILRECLSGAFIGRGLTVVKVDRKNTTKKCNICGHIEEKWEKEDEMSHKCGKCGIIWDRDRNAAKNIYEIWRNREQLGGKGVVEVKNAEKMQKMAKWEKLGKHKKKPLGNSDQNS